MTVEQIKDEYIKDKYLASHDLDNWIDFQNYFSNRHPEWFETHWENIIQIVQKECLKLADKNIGHFPNYRNLVSDKIVSKNNIIKQKVCFGNIKLKKKKRLR